MISKAFSPGHITAIFSIKDTESENILEQGSIGTGFSISEGVSTEVDTLFSDKKSIKIFINEKLVDAPVTKFVADYFLHLIDEKLLIILKHWIKLPIGAGFGCSAAGALSASLALNEKLNLNLSKTKCGQIAHIAEVKNRTGLGDVISSFFGGFEIRIKPGAPGIGKIKQIPIKQDICVICATGGILETKKVLSDSSLRKKITVAGNEYLQEIINNEAIKISEIIHLAKKFSFKTSLMTSEIKKALQYLEKAGFGDSSMIMLGKSIFCLTEEKNSIEVHNILNKYLPSWSIFNTKIDNRGARLIIEGD